jgi:hypothetical protein
LGGFLGVRLVALLWRGRNGGMGGVVPGLVGGGSPGGRGFRDWVDLRGEWESGKSGEIEYRGRWSWMWRKKVGGDWERERSMYVVVDELVTR